MMGFGSSFMKKETGFAIDITKAFSWGIVGVISLHEKELRSSLKNMKVIKMPLVDDLIRRTKLNRQSTEDWIKLYDEVDAFLNGDYPEADKERLLKEGCMEVMCRIVVWAGYIKEDE
jgi:hypothetical protein